MLPAWQAAGLPAMISDDHLAPLAARRDFHGAHATRNWFEWLAGRIEIGPGDRVLDVGSGPGWFWRGVRSAQPAEIVLSDISAGMVREALAHEEQIGAAAVSGVVADAVALPFPGGSFDVVVAMHVLYHASDPPAAVAELRRVMKPGGRCYVTTVGETDLEELAALTRAVYGSAAGDAAREAFGPDRAERLVAEAFGEAGREDFEDVYRVSSAEAVFRYLASMPPALGGGEPAPAMLSRAVTARLAEAGGVIETRRRAVLLSARA